MAGIAILIKMDAEDFWPIQRAGRRILDGA
jgi:hypothetical protein